MFWLKFNLLDPSCLDDGLSFRYRLDISSAIAAEPSDLLASSCRVPTPACVGLFLP